LKRPLCGKQDHRPDSEKHATNTHPGVLLNQISATAHLLRSQQIRRGETAVLSATLSHVTHIIPQVEVLRNRVLLERAT